MRLYLIKATPAFLVRQEGQARSAAKAAGCGWEPIDLETNKGGIIESVNRLLAAQAAAKAR